MIRFSLLSIIHFFTLLAFSQPETPIEASSNLIGPNHQISEVNQPVILSSTLLDTMVERYGKLECTLEVDATYSNPYNYNEVALSAVFTAPSGAQKAVDGFFMQDYNLNTANGAISPIGSGGFKLRFSPDEIGTWTFVASLTDSVGTTTFETQTFECIPVSNEKNNGFVRIGQTNYLEFDNGEQLILVGENIAWQDTDAYLDYKNWLTKLNDHGGNFFRLWHAHWGLGIEWKDNWEGFNGLGRYKESNCFYQDWLYDFCAEKGIYVMLALQHHGPVSSNVNSNWDGSPYNAANGGPCHYTWDFFTNEEAIALTKNRYRYIVARWGYSRSIQSWELFNEVNWTDDFETYIEDIQDWHADMAAYLKTIDPYQHLVSTSFAEDNQDPVVWSNPDIDFTQTHFYLNSSNIERALAGGVRRYLNDFEKPTLTGEFGLGPIPELSNADAEGIHLHNGMWGSLFAGGMGTAMSWWWDMYIHPRDLYYHFAPIAEVSVAIPFLQKNMRPGQSFVLGAPGDLVLTPSLGWSSIGDEGITINANGTTEPANPGLCQYLYGSQWNTEFRSPPIFNVNYIEEGEFRVRTGSDAGQNPKISIFLNGTLVLDEIAGTNEVFTIQVPAGPNQIKVDNLGTDWIIINSYSFSGLGSKVDAYALISEDKDVAAGWVLNNQYNHQYIEENGPPESILTGEVIIEDFEDGDYFVKWYDCLSGEMIAAEAVSAVDSQLLLPMPELYWDLAFRVDDEPVIVSTESIAQAQKLTIYPNPAKAGDYLNIDLGEETYNLSQVTMLDASGKPIEQLSLRENTFHLSSRLPSGIYWIKVETNKAVTTKPIVVSN